MEQDPRTAVEGLDPSELEQVAEHPENHFMGAGHNRLILYTYQGRAWVRAARARDPMPRHVERLSMLHQLGRSIA